MVLVKGGYYLKAYKLCQKLFAEKNLDIDAIDVRHFYYLVLSLTCQSIFKDHLYGHKNAVLPLIIIYMINFSHAKCLFVIKIKFH